MRQLRRDAPPTKDSSSNTQQQQQQQSNSQQPSWRQRFQKAPSQDSAETKTWNRPFLNQQRDQQQGEQRLSRRGARQAKREQHHRKDSDFLQGRRERSGELTPRRRNSGPNRDIRTVTLPNHAITVSEASALLRIKVRDIKRKLRQIGAASNDSLDVDTMELLALECGIETVRSTQGLDVLVDSEQLLMQQRRAEEEVDYPPRPPVVCIMGHVDHGKTTLMDALRRRSLKQQPKTKTSKKQKGGPDSKDVAGTEAGGITQTISAFQVAVEGQNDVVTFLDTPGHAAFKAMRQSGSHAADVIVLVVAADDGISEQTVEIIEFYKSIVKGSHDGGISMVVALNKIDKPGIDVDEARMRIENQLLMHGIITEGMSFTESEYGPPVQVISTSGLTGHGLDDLMEGLILQSEVMDLRADAEAHAEGIVMDARLEKGLGVVADCIVRWGNLKRGDVVVSGTQIAKVKMLKDCKCSLSNRSITTASPEVLCLTEFQIPVCTISQ